MKGTELLTATMTGGLALACASTADIDGSQGGNGPSRSSAHAGVSGTAGGDHGGAAEGASGTAANGGSEPGGAGGETTGRTEPGGAGSGTTGGTGTAGTNPGGAGGVGGTSGDGSPVNGRVIDFWGHVVPGIPVAIGDTTVTTDEDGEFAVDNVADEYDASLLVGWEHEREVWTYGWAYLGLTRRDPTLQVITAFHQQDTSFDVTLMEGAMGDNRVWTLALAGPDGASLVNDLLSRSSASANWAYWFGPASTTTTATALLWQVDQADLPMDFLGYDSQVITLLDGTTTPIQLDFSGGSLTTSQLTGSVAVSGAHDVRQNSVYVRFPSNVSIPIVNDHRQDGPLDEFSYWVPTIPSATISVAAIALDYSGLVGVAYADGLTASSKPVLVIPEAATPISPSWFTDVVTGDTEFIFAPAPNVRGHVVFLEEDVVEGIGNNQGIYVVTDGTAFTIPKIPGFELQADTPHTWRIATHGRYATVDEMTGEGGFLDPYCFGGALNAGGAPWFPRGPRAGNGELTWSEYGYFRTAE